MCVPFVICGVTAGFSPVCTGKNSEDRPATGVGRVEQIANRQPPRPGAPAYAGFNPSGENIRFKLPMDADLFCLIPEPYDVSIQYKNCGMLRVLNATEALRMYPWSAAVAHLTIKVTDDTVARNSHTFVVSRHEGETTVTIDDTATPDLECSIQALSQLLLGAATLPALLQNRTDIRFTGSPELLETLQTAFPTNPMFLIENF